MFGLLSTEVTTLKKTYCLSKLKIWPYDHWNLCLNPVPTKLGHVIDCITKKFPCQVGIGLKNTILKKSVDICFNLVSKFESRSWKWLLNYCLARHILKIFNKLSPDKILSKTNIVHGSRPTYHVGWHRDVICCHLFSTLQCSLIG